MTATPRYPHLDKATRWCGWAIYALFGMLGLAVAGLLLALVCALF